MLGKRLHAKGKNSYLLDSDNVRHGLNRDLGFTGVGRVENIRRVGEVAKLMVDAGLIVLVSFISPSKNERRVARGLSLSAEREFLEVFMDAPRAVCEMRVVKGLYCKARRGELMYFTGIDSRYEAPDAPKMRLQSAVNTTQECVQQVLARLI